MWLRAACMQINKAALQHGVTPRYVSGFRVTDAVGGAGAAWDVGVRQRDYTKAASRERVGGRVRSCCPCMRGAPATEELGSICSSLHYPPSVFITAH